MICKYRLLKYIDNPDRNEPKNIGIIVIGRSNKTHARLLGRDREDINRYKFESFLSENTINDSWVYDEWVKWFEAVIGDSSDLNEKWAVLDRLENFNPYFKVSDEFSIEIDDKYSLSPIDYLYDKFVDNDFDRYIKRLFVLSELSNRSDFYVNRIISDKENRELFFDFVLYNDKNDDVRIYFKTCRTFGVTEDSTVKCINDIRFTFSSLEDETPLKNNSFVVLSDDENDIKLSNLDNKIIVIGIYSDSAYDRLQEILSDE